MYRIRDYLILMFAICLFSPLVQAEDNLYRIDGIPDNLHYDVGESYTDLDTNNTWNEGEVFIDTKNPKYHRVLNWSPTNEPDESFSNYVIYRVKNINAEKLINPENCECEIVTLTKIDTSFTDSMVTEESGIYAYFYQIRVIAGGSGRNSYIYNYTNFTSP